MNRAAVEAQLAELPLAEYVWFETAELEFSERIRTVCRHMYRLKIYFCCL